MSAPRLSERLSRVTREVHTHAERAGIMRRLLAGQVGATEYMCLLESLHVIYAALEPALADVRVRSVVAMPGLHRAEALARDIADLGVMATKAAPVTAATQYAEHICSLVDRDPMLIAAHAYVRYLGDLSGGQILGSIVRKALRLPDGHGTAFFRFGDARSVDRDKTAVRAGLDALPRARHGDVIDEVITAFERHVVLFREIGQDGGKWLPPAA